MITTNGTLISSSQRRQLEYDEQFIFHWMEQLPKPMTYYGVAWVPFENLYKQFVDFGCTKTLLHQTQVGISLGHYQQNLEGTALALALAEVHGVDRIDFDSLIAYKPEQRNLHYLNKSDTAYKRLPKAFAVHNHNQYNTTLNNFDKVETRGHPDPLLVPMMGCWARPVINRHI